jgi:hypothetical protein
VQVGTGFARSHHVPLLSCRRSPTTSAPRTHP